MFEGFSPQTIDFMWGIRFNNEKSWFEAHKQEDLTYFYHPMQALSQEVYQRFALAHPELELIVRVSRIYRDARRLRGRGPYKDRLWYCIQRPSESWTGDPVFWFEVEPGGYSYGLGYYSASPLTMAKFRARLDRDPKPMERLARAFRRQDAFQLEGEDYRRSKGDPSSLLRPWYQKKNFTLSRSCPHDQLLFSHDLVDTLVEGYEFLLPFYRYFITLPGDPDPTL